MALIDCYCNSGEPFRECCEPYIKGNEKATTAEVLMRSRYSAYVLHEADYLWTTTVPKERKHHSKETIRKWAKSNQWIKLEVLAATKTTVEFKAYYLDHNLQAQEHHEKSNFVRLNGVWFYVDAEY